MRKGLLPSLLISFILLCGCAGPETDPGLALRSRILEKGCCFDAEITADYGDSLSVFAMHCQADSAGSLRFTVTAPESIAGISGNVAAGTGKLLFEDKAVSFPLLADPGGSALDLRKNSALRQPHRFRPGGRWHPALH